MIRVRPLRLSLLAAFVLCCACATNVEEDWIAIGIATDGTELFVDGNSVKARPQGFELSQRFVLGEPKKLGMSEIRERVVYHCDERRVAILRSEEFDGSGRLLPPFGSAPGRSASIRAGSLAELVHSAFC